MDVISKNGNFVLNVGPKADGTFCKEETEILKKLSDWTNKNSEAIWGTQPFKVYGEGKNTEVLHSMKNITILQVIIVSFIKLVRLCVCAKT